MPKISARQQRILAFLKDFLEENSYPPTVRDIQNGCDISSTSVVDYNLRILQREGHIRRSPEVSRGIELLGEGRRERRRTRAVPIMGYIAAGKPMPVPGSEGWGSGEALETLDLAEALTGGRQELYALRVRGQSMIDALIDDGDVVVIEPAQQANSGDMVVAWLTLEKEATLKRFYMEGDRVRLQPANSQMRPLYVNPADLEIQGRVVAVVRQVA